MLKSMRLLILSPYFAPSSAIGAARMTSLAGFLAEKGFLVDVVSFGHNFQPGDKWNRSIPDSVSVHMVNNGTAFTELENKMDELMGNNNYSLVISSMGPFQTTRFVSRLCKKWKTPFILDYRDAWLFYTYYYRNVSFLTKIKMLLKDTYYLKYEKRCIKEASAIVTVTDKNSEILKSRYKRYKKKITTIYNGHDELPVCDDPDLQEEEYSIGCAGKFLYYNQSYAREFLRVLNRLRESGQKVKLLHIGNSDDDASQLIENEGLNSDIYTYLGQFSYEDAMRFLSTQSAVLIIYGYCEGLGTKVFDYIGLNKPIIYYGVFPSELSMFVSKFSNIVATSSSVELERGIRSFIEKKITKLNESRTEKYSRKFQNGRYFDLIQSLTN